MALKVAFFLDKSNAYTIGEYVTAWVEQWRKILAFLSAGPGSRV